MASERGRPSEAFDGVGLLRYAGCAALILAAVVAYFYSNAWLATATGDRSRALLASLGALLLAATVPLLLIMIARIWRDSAFAKLETHAAELYNLLVGRSSGYSKEDIIHDMIVLYGEASGVNGRIGLFLAATLSLSIISGAFYMDRLVHAHGFTRNQANLLVLFLMILSFAFWALLWPERKARADQLDPSGVFASSMR